MTKRYWKTLALHMMRRAVRLEDDWKAERRERIWYFEKCQKLQKALAEGKGEG